MNSNLNGFVTAIMKAITSQDNNERKQAEQQILYYRDSNPTEFFSNLSLIIKDESFNDHQRQSAGTVASRCLGIKNNNTNNFYWDQVNQNHQQNIKENVLSALVCPSKSIMKSAASIIANIAAIELPRKLWGDLIDNLTENCNHESSQIRQASITTMGYICQQLKYTNGQIQDRLLEQILGAIIISLRRNQTSTVQTALKALQDSLSFLQPLMNDAKYRDTVFACLIEQFKAGDQLQGTFRALDQFVKAASPFLISYRKALTDLTEAFIDRGIDEAGSVIQIWQTIGSEYAEKQEIIRQRIGDYKNEQNFMQQVAGQVLPLIMKCLVNFANENNEQEEIKWSAISGIQAFIKVCDKNVVDLVTQGVANVLSSNKPAQIQSSVLLFSTLCQYPDRDYVCDIFRQGFELMFSLLTHENTLILKNSLYGFIRLAEAFPQVILTHPNLQQIIDAIFTIVYKKQDSEMKHLALTIIANFTQGLKQNPERICDNPGVLLQKVVKFYAANYQEFHDKMNEINQKLITIIMNIVMNTSKREIICQLIEFIIDQYYKVVQNNDLNNREYLVQQFLSVLHTSVLAHKNAVPNNQLLSKICQLVDHHINRVGKLQTQGLSLLGALATTFNKSFETRSSKYWGMVKQCLNYKNQISTFKAALACIGDFARMMQSTFFNNAQQVMNILLKDMRDSLDRDLKLCIISCMGDLVLSIQEYATTFIVEILNVIDLCFQAVYELTNNPKDIDYVEELKTNLIEMYSCIVFASNGKKPCKQLYEHYGNLATFIVRTCDKNVHPTIDYLKSCLYLLHDSAAFYWNNVAYKEKIKEITNSKEITDLVYLIEKYHDRPEVKELMDFIHSRNSI